MMKTKKFWLRWLLVVVLIALGRLIHDDYFASVFIETIALYVATILAASQK